MEGPTVGQRFREKREAKGLTLEEVAALTKIPSVFLKAIEEDDYRLLPDEMYLLGFLSEYAIFLGLNPHEVVTLFRDQVKRAKRSFIPAPLKVYKISLRKTLLPLTILLILTPLVFIGLSLFQQPQEAPSVKSRPLESPAQVAPTGPPAVEGQPAAPSPEAPPPLQEAVLPMQAPLQHTLTAKALELTWMAVNINGGEKHEVLLRPGEVTQWTAKERFILTIGNAGGIELTLDGTVLPPLGASGQVIRRLILPRE
ncbi:MAG: helix-turn-helix domain-containing protein [Candidatus Methylomirabilales bacterium]